MITSANPEGEPFRIAGESLGAWGILESEYLSSSLRSATLLNGGAFMAMYSIIGILDVGAHPDSDSVFDGSNASSASEALLSFQATIRATFGRPAGVNGITPLVISRSLASNAIEWWKDEATNPS